MDTREYYERLGSSAGSPSGLFEHFEKHSVDGRTHHILPDARHGVERGTVIVEDADAIVRGFPSIARIFVLETGIPSVFEADETIAIEEKLNGSNVRIADVDGPVAFTRSGYICPYTTDRARHLLDLAAFFDDHPEKMVCAELIGPETPYTSHEYDDVDSHAFRVFDVRDRASGDPLPVTERRELCAAYDFPQPQLFGLYDTDDAPGAVREAIDTLDAAGREGVVLKTRDESTMVKYTTASQHHSDLAHAFSLPFDYGRDFLFSRLVREAFQAAEFEEEGAELRDRAHDIGESILLPMVETIRDVEDGQPVGERHTVRGTDESVAALLDHLEHQSMELLVGADYREDGERVVEFIKVSESTQDQIQYYLDGGTRDV